MAFPAVVGRNVYDGLADTSHAINIGSPADGTLVVIIARVTTTTTISWPAGWTLLVDNDQTDGSNDATCIAYRLCDGTEGATVTVTTAITGKVSAVAYEITGAANPATQPPEVSTVATGTSATPDPSSLSPTGGAKDYLWLWLGAWEGEQTSPPTGNPTNYTNPTGGGQSTAGTVVNNCRVAVAERNLNAASEDPPSWTIDAADDWSAWTMAVHPAPSGTNFDETGRLVTITSTVSQTDNLSFGEAVTVTVASTLAATDRADYVQALATTVTATITVTDSHDASEAVSVAVVATVTATDSIRNVEAATVTVASTITATDALSFGEAAAVAIASTVTASDFLFLTEALTVTITSTVTGTDVLTGAQNYDETGRLVTVAATVTGTDQAASTDALTVTVTSTVFATDLLTATDDAAFTIVSTITGSDILSGAPINYNETGRLVSIVSTVTATDQVDVDENVTVTVASTVTATDLLGFSEAATVTIVSTVTGDDLATLTDNVGFTIVATITVTDRITGPTFWQTDPTGYTVNPAAYTKNPAAYVPVGPSDSPPW